MDSERKPKAKVFISYSRKNAAFADRLEAGLAAHGFVPLIDRTEIYAFEDWWKRIEALIAQADTVVFVLSPDGIASEVTQKEIAFAASLSKRLAPIVYQRVDDKALPPTLASLNFILFDDPARFDESMERLAEALATDIDWVRRHTEFGELARRWAIAGRPGPRGLLLRSPVLEEAERWIASRPRGAPPPTADTQTFIAHSRQAATRRRNIVTGSLAAGLCIVAALAATALVAFYAADAERNDALIAQSQFLARQAHAATTQGNATRGALLALAALPKKLTAPDRPFIKAAAYALEDALAHLRERMILTVPRPGGGFDLMVRAVALSPDGTRVATASEDNSARVWDARTGKLVLTLTHPKPVQWVTFSADNARLMTAAGDSGCLQCSGTSWHVWDAAGGGESLTLQNQELNLPLLSPDGERVVAGAKDGPLELHDAATGKSIATLAPPGARRAVFSPDGESILVVLDKRAQLWEAESGTMVREFAVPGGYPLLQCCAFSPDGSRVILGGSDRNATIFDATTGEQIASLGPHRDWPKAPAFSADNARVVTVAKTTAHVWDGGSGAAIATLEHDGDVDAAAFSPDASRLLTETRNQVRLWDAATGRQIASLRVPDGGKVLAALFSPGGERLLVAFEAASTQLIDAATGAQVARLDGVPQPAASAFTPDKRFVLTAAPDGAARIFDVKTGNLVAVLRGNAGPTTPIESAALSADGRRVVTKSYSTVQAWDAEPAIVSVLRGHEGSIHSAAFSPDGGRLATASADRTVRIWDVRAGTVLATLRGHGAEVVSVAFSPDGKRIVTASADNTARIWDAMSGAALLVLNGHDGAVNAAGFSPDGKRIVTASADKTARIWDATSGGVILVYREHDGAVMSAAFSPDGKQVVSASGTLLIWDAQSGATVKTLKQLRATEGLDSAWRDVTDPRLAAAWNGEIRRWEALSTSRALRNGWWRSFAAFSPSGAQVLGAPTEWLLEVWNVETGRPSHML